MKNGFDLLVELYTLSVTKHVLHNICLAHKDEPEYKLGGSESEKIKDKTILETRKAAQDFMNPVFDKLRDNQIKLPYYYQKKLFNSLNYALRSGIIDADGNVLAKEQFVGKVLKQCALPDPFNLIESYELSDRRLICPLTNFNVAHIIKKRINTTDPSLFPRWGIFDPGKRTRLKEEGVTAYYDTLKDAIYYCGYKDYVTSPEIQDTYGEGQKGLMLLSTVIASRMAGRDIDPDGMYLFDKLVLAPLQLTH